MRADEIKTGTLYAVPLYTSKGGKVGLNTLHLCIAMFPDPDDGWGDCVQIVWWSYNVSKLVSYPYTASDQLNLEVVQTPGDMQYHVVHEDWRDVPASEAHPGVRRERR